MRIVAIIQARMQSTRLPGKVLTDICGYPLIWHISNRVKKSKRITNLVLATSNNKADDALERWAKQNAIDVYRGSEQNVLERYYGAAVYSNADIIVRITADDPFKDPAILDQVIDLLVTKHLDFAYNNKPPTFPEGLDCEVFTMKALKVAYENATDDFEKEHVTQHFYRNPQQFTQDNFQYEKNISSLRWTIDTEDDLKMAKEVYNHLFKENEVFLMRDILDLIEQKPYIPLINQNVSRSTMYSNN